MDFDPGPANISSRLRCNDKDDVYIAKLNHDGEFIWAYGLGGLGNDAGTESVIDPFGNIFITGYFEGLGAFAPQGPSPDTLLSSGSTDPFLVKWRQCLETTSEVDAMSGDSYISPSGHHVWNTSGVYQDTLTNLAGCDSILTITSLLYN